jgi:outer membrane protein assembly factor BamB
MDAKSGQTRWSFTAGGRIDLPPTIDQGLCLFGSHDGWIYCLDARNGELRWRFRGAPQEARIMAYGQIESPWPVPGNVLVENGIAYVAAGRHPMCDGGVQVLALKSGTGELVWEKNIDDITYAIKDWYGGTIQTNRKIGLDFEPVDILVRDGDALSMSRWRFKPATGDYQLRLGNTAYKAGALEVPRGLWSYGIRQTKKVQTRAPVAFDETRIYTGKTNQSSILLAGKVLIDANDCELNVGGAKIAIPAAPVHDGVIAAYGRLYVSLQNGTLLCLE